MKTTKSNAEIAQDLAELIIPISSFGPAYVKKKAALIESALTTAQSTLAREVLAHAANRSLLNQSVTTSSLRDLFARLQIKLEDKR